MSNEPTRMRLKDAVLHVIEHEADIAAGESRMHVHWERDWPLLDKLMGAARAGQLKIYHRGEFQCADPGKLPPPTALMRYEVYVEDVDVWLDLHETRTPFRFRNAPGLVRESEPATSISRVSWRVAVEDQLDRLIEEHGGEYPDHKTALAWFKKNDTTGTFAMDDDADGFRWVMFDGSQSKSVPIKTFMNCIARIRKSRSIPG